MESSVFDHLASLCPLLSVGQELQDPVLILIKAVPVDYYSRELSLVEIRPDNVL